MNQQIKADWLLALASKKYMASRKGWLCTRTATSAEYSSLGVLCELAREAGVPFDYTAEDFALPLAVAQWAELDALPWIRIAKPSGIFNLAYINQLGGGTFELEAEAIYYNL